jgi:hypothetical protein
MATLLKLSMLSLPLLCLAACGDVERSFGLVRDVPDEFTVETRAPLSMPPSFGNLRAPEPGAARPQEVSAPQAAEAALAPDTAITNSQGAPITPGQQALDAQAGPAAPADIRQKVESEQALDRPPDVLEIRPTPRRTARRRRRKPAPAHQCRFGRTADGGRKHHPGKTQDQLPGHFLRRRQQRKLAADYTDDTA